jgi:hypothetical protein
MRNNDTPRNDVTKLSVVRRWDVSEWLRLAIFKAMRGGRLETMPRGKSRDGCDLIRHAARELKLYGRWFDHWGSATMMVREKSVNVFVWVRLADECSYPDEPEMLAEVAAFADPLGLRWSRQRGGSDMGEGTDHIVFYPPGVQPV